MDFSERIYIYHLEVNYEAMDGSREAWCQRLNGIPRRHPMRTILPAN